MNKIQVLRIANHIILALSIIGYFAFWQDSRSEEIKPYVIASLFFSIFGWLFILIFCDNAEDSKEVLSLLKGRNIQKKDRKEDKNEIIEIEDMKRTVNLNDLIVKVKKSGKIEKIKNEDWEQIKKLGNEDKFEIKYRKLFK